MRRARLLVYDGPEEWIAATKEQEDILEGRNNIGEGKWIQSVELNAAELTLFECKYEQINEVVDGL